MANYHFPVPPRQHYIQSLTTAGGRRELAWSSFKKQAFPKVIVAEYSILEPLEKYPPAVENVRGD